SGEGWERVGWEAARAKIARNSTRRTHSTVAQALRRINMSAPSKPGGYTSLSPYLVVHGAQRVIDFLKQTFGATELRRYDNPDGTIMHAEVRVDDTVVMIADGGGVWPPFPSWLHVYVPDLDATYHRARAPMVAAGGGVCPPFPSWLHVYVPDVDATYQRALAAGGISVQEPQMREGDPDRRVASKIPVEIPGGSLPRWHDGARAQNSWFAFSSVPACSVKRFDTTAMPQRRPALS